MLNVLGRGVRWPAFCVNSLDSLYAGALHQFTTGRMGWSGLCSFIRPLMVGAEGFMLVYFHFESCNMSVLLLCIVFQICVWYDFVGSVDMVWNWFACRKSCTLDSYSWVGRITKELPLSAPVIIALLFLSLDCMVLIVLASGCALWVGWWLLFCCRVLMRSATSFLYTSRLDVGSCDMAVSASRARFCIQFCCLVCRLYLGPFCVGIFHDL